METRNSPMTVVITGEAKWRPAILFLKGLRVSRVKTPQSPAGTTLSDRSDYIFRQVPQGLHFINRRWSDGVTYGKETTDTRQETQGMSRYMLSQSHRDCTLLTVDAIYGTAMRTITLSPAGTTLCVYSAVPAGLGGVGCRFLPVGYAVASPTV